MTAKRVGSAHKAPATIAAALDSFPDLVKRAEKLARAINERHPGDEPQDVESILYVAIISGLDAMEEHDRRQPVPVAIEWRKEPADA